jgi:alkylated DNA repair dioxygenase AlkB
MTPNVFASRLSLGRALRATALRGYAYVADALDPSFQRALDREIDAGPWQRFEHDHGRVRMQIEGFDLELPMDGFPAIAALRAELERVVRRDGEGIRGLATWRPNEAGAVRYQPGAMGISAHMDGKWYRRLVVVVTVRGTAPFSVHEAREAPPVARWTAAAGGLTLMRGPGLGGVRDGRSFHSIPGPKRGTRISIALRMAVDPPP